MATPEQIDYPAWITAIAAAVGVPLSFYAFIKLVKRDRQRESQIASLANISKQLTDQVQELSAQTQEFKYQSVIMFEHNKLFEQQLVLQTKGQKENADLRSEQLKLQKQERRDAIKPYLTVKQSTEGNGGLFWDLVLINQGDRATEIRYQLKEPNQGLVKPERHEVGRNSTLYTRINFVSAPATAGLVLNYQDLDGNCYSQVVSYIRPDATISKPLLLTSV